MSPLYKIGKFRHLLAYIGRFVFPIREPERLYQNRESPGEIGRLEKYVRQKDIESLNFHEYLEAKTQAKVNTADKQVQLLMRGIKRKTHAQKMSEGHSIVQEGHNICTSEWKMLGAILKANTVDL